MIDMAAIRAGLARNLRSLDAQVSGYTITNPTPPAVEMFVSGVDYRLASQRGLELVNMTVRAYVGYGTDRGAQERLDAFTDEQDGASLKALLETDPQLGGAAADLFVATRGPEQLYAQSSGNPLLGCEWQVQVYV